MENKYSQGKIYRIVSDKGNMVYIGSTVASLERRFQAHKSNFRHHQNRSVCSMFMEYGVDSCRIELLEVYPCQSKEELCKREGYHQRLIECINNQIAGRDKAGWIEENREFYLKRCAEYYQQHKKQYQDYYQNNRNHRAAMAAIYYQANLEHIREWRNTKINCPCGGKCTNTHKALHIRTKRHQQWQQQQQPEFP